MAGTNLGTAYVTIMPSTKGIGASMSKSLSGEAAAAGKSSGSSWAGMFKAAIVAAGIGALVKKSLDFGGELQQNLGGTEAVFGEFADEIQTKATEAYKTMGLSASDYMATANKMGSLFQGSGLEQQRALQLTTDAMQRAADVASVMGIDQQMAMESIAGAAKGNFTMMDNLGVAMNATTLQAYALEKGVNFKWDTASNAEKAELAMQMFMDRTSQYASNFAKESETTFTGSFGAMKAAAENVLANMALGQSISVPLQELGTMIQNFVFNNLVPMIANILNELPTLLQGSIEIIAGMFDLATTHADQIIQFGVNILTTLLNGILQSIPLIAEMATSLIQAIVDTFTNADLIGQILNVFVTGIPMIVDAGISIINALAQGISEIGPRLPEILYQIGQAALEIFKNIDWIGLGKAVINFILTSWQTWGNLVWTLLSDIGSTAKQWFENIDWHQAGYNLVTWLVNGISSIGSNIGTTLLEIGEAAWNWFISIDWIGLGVQVLTAVWNGLLSIGSSIIDFFFGIGEAAVDTITSTDWWGVGSDIISGIINGIWSAASSLYQSLRNLASNALQSAKNALGIGSPSKLFRDQIGQWIPEGIAVGIEENASSVTDAMDEIARDSIATIDAGLNVGSSGGLGGFAGVGSATNSPITINVYPSAGMDERRLAEMVSRQLALAQRQRQAAWGNA